MVATARRSSGHMSKDESSAPSWRCILTPPVEVISLENRALHPVLRGRQIIDFIELCGRILTPAEVVVTAGVHRSMLMSS